MSDRISIREFKVDDAKEIVRLHKESAESFEEVEVTEEFINSIAQRADFRFFVAAHNREVIGYVGLLFHVNVGRAELGPICVSPGHRGRGVGTKIIDYVTRFLSQLGTRRIIVKVKISNKHALNFFKGNGFVQEGYFKKYTIEEEDVVQLRRFI